MTDFNPLQWLREQAELYDEVGEPGAYEYGCKFAATVVEMERLQTQVKAAYFAGWDEGVTGDSPDAEMAYEQYQHERG